MWASALMYAGPILPEEDSLNISTTGSTVLLGAAAEFMPTTC